MWAPCRALKEEGELVMENYKLTVENGIITDIEMLRVEEPSPDGTLPGYELIEACLFIPKDVIGFSEAPEFLESLIGFDPLAIEVEEGNKVFAAVNNCLIRKADRTMILGCRNSRIPGNGLVEHIGPCVLCTPIELEEMDLRDFEIPYGVKTIGYRALANSTDDDDILISIPDSVEKIETMGLMMMVGEGHSCVMTFMGSPELEPGVFGTKAEAEDSNYDAFKTMPDILYVKPERLLVRGLKNSSVEKYCRKYAIPFEVINEYYETVMFALFGLKESCSIDFCDEFYETFDAVADCLNSRERKVLREVYLNRVLSRAMRKMRNPVRSKRLRPFIHDNKASDGV